MPIDPVAITVKDGMQISAQCGRCAKNSTVSNADMPVSWALQHKVPQVCLARRGGTLTPDPQLVSDLVALRSVRAASSAQYCPFANFDNRYTEQCGRAVRGTQLKYPSIGLCARIVTLNANSLQAANQAQANSCGMSCKRLAE